MSETIQNPDQNEFINEDIQFGEEITIMQGGFSFQPVVGLELEIDDMVYMYSDDGNLEISLMGGALEDKASIAEINDSLAAKVLGNVDRFELIEAGTDSIQGVRGFLNKVNYVDADQAGIGLALICSPFLNQFFFMMVITSEDYWESKGHRIFTLLKETIQFHPQFMTDELQKELGSYSDLMVETYEFINPEVDFMLSIEKGDISFLLAARAYSENDLVRLTQLSAPDGTLMYQYNPETGDFSSTIYEEPLIGKYGEVSIFFPRDNQKALTAGSYIFDFSTQSGKGLQEIQVVLRRGPVVELQALDFNFWLAVDEDIFYNQQSLDQLEQDIFSELKQKLNPYNLMPGKIEFVHPAMDELEAFSSINIQTDLADCSYMISENVNNPRGLNIGLVAYIYDGDPETGSKIHAVSSGSPGMIMSTTSPHSCILLEWPAFKDDLPGLVDALLEQLIIFSGIDTRGVQSSMEQGLHFNHEITWRIRRHPLFYDAN